MTNISNRKDDHIKLALKVRHQSQSDSHFDRLTFEHSGLPETDSNRRHEDFQSSAHTRSRAAKYQLIFF